MIHLRNELFLCCWVFSVSRMKSFLKQLSVITHRHRTCDARMFCCIIDWLFVTLITGCVVQRNYAQLRTHRAHCGVTEGTGTQDTYIVQNCRTIKSFGEWRFMNMIRWHSTLMNPWDSIFAVSRDENQIWMAFVQLLDSSGMGFVQCIVEDGNSAIRQSENTARLLDVRHRLWFDLFVAALRASVCVLYPCGHCVPIHASSRTAELAWCTDGVIVFHVPNDECTS